jgi:Amt family ammonium transporter
LMAAALAAALSYRGEHTATEIDGDLATPMPAAHLPLLGWLGALLMVVGWMATTGLAHVPDGAGVSIALSATNLALAAAGGACASGLYAWFATGKMDVLMTGRGMAAGLAVTAAGAAFVPTWSALAAGIAAGAAVPPVLFVCERRWKLREGAVPLAVFGLPAMVGLLLPGLLADGRFGMGWNRVGLDSYLGVTGQGVSGAWVVPGLAADWPGQLFAQGIGAAAIVAWSLGVCWMALAVPAAIIRGWQRSGLEFGTPPAPLPPENDLSARPTAVSSSDDLSSATDPVQLAPDRGGSEQ